MLVYGPQEYQERLRELLEQLRRRAAGTRADCLEELRTLAIQTGQLEQGIEDSQDGGNPVEPQLLKQIRSLTERAATAFHQSWTRASAIPVGPGPEARSTLRELARDLDYIRAPGDLMLTLKIPEGFEYYALFPEQYCVSALKWAEEHAGAWPKRVVVVGIRSIGTTLSALVAVVLTAEGWQVTRLTVRPTGHPFARRVELRPADLGAPKRAVVVDEGPGLSGSSMAAVAQSLAQAGITNISFFPGHGGEPGPAASSEVRRWWAAIPRYWTPLEDLRWNGVSLAESLAARTAELCGARPGAASKPKGLEQEAVEDLSAGLWRRRVFANETDWPAVFAPFERMKFRCAGKDGLFVLWKFAGFGCGWKGGRTSNEAALRQVAARAEQNLVPPLLGSFGGFIAFPWIEGTRLARRDSADPQVLNHIGRYLLASAAPALSGAESRASILRLQEMLYCNVKEALGDLAADRSREWADAAGVAEPAPAYGDGRMAPHEWVRTRAGRILKTDFTGHDLDHTLVGRQSLLWDVAGALVEWNLSLSAVGAMLQPLREAGISICPKALTFYQMAYAGFRMGLSSFCASQSPADSADQERLQRASAAYCRTLRRLLEL